MEDSVAHVFCCLAEPDHNELQGLNVKLVAADLLAGYDVPQRSNMQRQFQNDIQ